MSKTLYEKIKNGEIELIEMGPYDDGPPAE